MSLRLLSWLYSSRAAWCAVGPGVPSQLSLRFASSAKTDVAKVWVSQLLLIYLFLPCLIRDTFILTGRTGRTGRDPASQHRCFYPMRRGRKEERWETLRVDMRIHEGTRAIKCFLSVGKVCTDEGKQ